jgi:Zn-finger nucleic acid-binding protein
MENSSAGKKCPVCGTVMREERHGDVMVDLCQHGIWLDKSELFRLTEQARHTEPGNEYMAWLADLMRDRIQEPGDDDRVLLCPLSGKEMHREPYEGIQIDWSPGHGVWLDAGELEAILSNLRLQPSYLRRVSLRLTDLRY